LIIILGMLGLGIWSATWAAYVDTIHPGTLGITIAELEAKLGTPLHLQAHPHYGVTYTLTYGEIRTIYFPSGPPAYLFDGSGRLVDWTPDVGDGAAFRQTWGL
jgi:hypothetical protein